LQRLFCFCPADLVGDDAAVLSVPPTRSLVITTDVLVDGVHFSDRTTAPADAGWRAAAANLSDLAAMGAMPLGITVGLGVPGDVTVAWIEQLYQGLTACLQTYDTSIVGGDVCRSPVITVSITAFGAVEPTRIIRRAAARSGDAIVVTGKHGAARAGLELLLHPATGEGLSSTDRASLIQAHQRPKPRLDVLPLLWKTLETQEFRVAGMDSSDGLADAILQICRASGVGARVDRSRIPMPSGLQQWVQTEQALEWALYGGEDFELVLCLPPALAESLVQSLVQNLGTGAAIVGTLTPTPEVWLVDALGNAPPVALDLAKGFQHFGA
jgi:thiamine-monophosphate kinase